MGIEKVRYTHEAMIDQLITNPHLSQGELAALFGYSAGWISTILASDAFQEKLAARREEIVDPIMKATMEERFRALSIQSLDILRQKLDRPAHQVSDLLVLKTAELSAKALGYGARTEAPPAVPVGRIEALADRLTGLLVQKKSEVIEGELVETGPATKAG